MKFYLVISFIMGAYSLSSALRDKIYVLQSPNGTDEKKMVVITWSEDQDGDGKALECAMFTDKRLIDEVLKESTDHEIRKPSAEEMKELMEECTTYSNRRRRRTLRNMLTKRQSKDDDAEMAAPGQEGTTEGYDGWNVIFPGTKWCGAGDIAKSYDDLGLHQDTDRCCRAHDNCNDTMAPGQEKNNLTNTSPFTKLSCQCDDDFYNCLDRINSVTSNTIGNMYFNLLARTCYAEEYPTTGKCKKYRSFLKITCKEYNRNTTAEPVYQWISAKRYKKLPLPSLGITL